MKYFKTLSERTLIFSIVLTLIIAVFVIRHNFKTATLIADFYSGIIGQSVDSLLYASEIPEMDFLRNNSSFTQNQFNASARSAHNIQAFDFLSYTPSRSVQFVYPYENYKHMVGTNGFFKPEESHYSQRAAASNKSLTYTYKDSNSSIHWLVIKNPIISKTSTKTEDFLGFITMAFSIDTLANKFKFENLEQLGYNYELSVIENDTFSTIKKSPVTDNIFSVNKSITVAGSTLNFTLYLPFFSVINPVLLILTFLSMRFFYYAYIQLKQRKELSKQQLEYELYIDSLTGAYSKKKLETMLDEKSQATLLYIVLKGHDEFEAKNGKVKGDELLVAFSKRLQYNIKDAFVVRLGGDEFVVFLEGDIPFAATEGVIKRIKGLASQPFSISGVIANISARVGYANLPEDSTKFTSLINIAMERIKK